MRHLTPDKTVLRQTGFVAVVTVILSCLMHAVFLIAGLWNWTVLTGNLLGAVAAVLNFFLMGLTVQSAVGRSEKQAKNFMRMSQSLRLVMLFAIAAVGALLDVFSTAATLISLFFPRIAVFVWQFLEAKKSKKESENQENEQIS